MKTIYADSAKLVLTRTTLSKVDNAMSLIAYGTLIEFPLPEADFQQWAPNTYFSRPTIRIGIERSPSDQYQFAQAGMMYPDGWNSFTVVQDVRSLPEAYFERSFLHRVLMKPILEDPTNFRMVDQAHWQAFAESLETAAAFMHDVIKDYYFFRNLAPFVKKIVDVSSSRATLDEIVEVMKSRPYG